MKYTRPQWLKMTGWVIPLAYAAGAVALGQTLPRWEHHVLPETLSGMSVPAALAIGSSIASGMLALTGIVFSLTFVMVQFSATAYSPRLVLWVARDPLMSHALGVFSATFLYALSFMAWADRDTSGRVPLISAWLVVGLLLASMGMFIALVERVAMLQVNRMLIFTGDEGRRAITEMYGSGGSGRGGKSMIDGSQWPVIQTVTHAGRPQVVQAVDMQGLVEAAAGHGAFIEVMLAVGDTVIEPMPLVRARGQGTAPSETVLRSAIQLGDERTFEQDPKYALRLLVDIAIKALSPAINDPTTAVQALDQIEDLLVRLGRCYLSVGSARDEAGVVRVQVPMPGWEDFLRLGLDEIRAYGADSIQVMRRMHALIQNLTTLVPPGQRAALHEWERRLEGTVARTFEDATDQHDASVPDRQGLGIGEEGSSPNA